MANISKDNDRETLLQVYHIYLPTTYPIEI